MSVEACKFVDLECNYIACNIITVPCFLWCLLRTGRATETKTACFTGLPLTVLVLLSIICSQVLSKVGEEKSSHRKLLLDLPCSSRETAARGERRLPRCQTGRSPWDPSRWHGDLAAGRSQTRPVRCGLLSCLLLQHPPVPLLLLLPACACQWNLAELPSSQQGRVTAMGHLGHLKRARHRHIATVTQLGHLPMAPLLDGQLTQSSFVKIQYSATGIHVLLPREWEHFGAAPSMHRRRMLA